MSARLVLPGVLRDSAGGCGEVAVEGPTLRAALDGLAGQLPLLERRLRDEQGALRRHVLLFVNGVEVGSADGLETRVPDGAEVFVAPAISGG